MRLEIENRSKRDPKYSFSGKWVLFEVRSTPFPHKLFAGAFNSLAEAKAEKKRLARKRG